MYGVGAGVVTLCYGAPCVSYFIFILICSKYDHLTLKTCEGQHNGGYGVGLGAGIVKLIYGGPCVSYCMFILIRRIYMNALLWVVKGGGEKLDVKPGIITTV